MTLSCQSYIPLSQCLLVLRYVVFVPLFSCVSENYSHNFFLDLACIVFFLLFSQAPCFVHSTRHNDERSYGSYYVVLVAAGPESGTRNAPETSCSTSTFSSSVPTSVFVFSSSPLTLSFFRLTILTVMNILLIEESTGRCRMFLRIFLEFFDEFSFQFQSWLCAT